MAPTSRLSGVLAMILAMAAFTANDTLMKQVAADLPPLQVIAMRGVFATALMLVVVFVMGEARAMRRLADPTMTLRSTVEFVSIVAFITALARFPIADVIAIAQMAPLLLVPMAALLYGERIGAYRAGLIGCGFLAALMVTQPGAQGFDPLVLVAFVCTASQAARDLLQRRIDPTIPSSVIALSTCAVVAIIAAPLAFLFGVKAMAPWHVVYLAFSAAGLACGHLLVVNAFRAAPIGVVAPFFYSATIWATVSGFFVFGDRPDVLTLCGIALLVAAGAALARASATGR